jgi:hypothetical protein
VAPIQSAPSDVPGPDPECPTCGSQMAWYRSELRSQKPLAMTHFYGCMRCDHVAMVDALGGADRSAPQFVSGKDEASLIWLTRKAG